GAATAKSVGPWERGVKRVDEDGDDLRINNRRRNGVIEIVRYKSWARALKLGLPGVSDYLRDALPPTVSPSREPFTVTQALTWPHGTQTTPRRVPDVDSIPNTAPIHD